MVLKFLGLTGEKPRMMGGSQGQGLLAKFYGSLTAFAA